MSIETLSRMWRLVVPSGGGGCVCVYVCVCVCACVCARVFERLTVPNSSSSSSEALSSIT